MKNILKNFSWAILTLLLTAFVFSLFLNAVPGGNGKLSLNELVDKINQGAVEKITVSGSRLSVTLKDGGKFFAQKETESSLSETLSNYGVNTGLLQQVRLDVEEESGFRYWMSVILPALLPLIMIGFLFWWMFRQARSGMNQAFTFGKANIRLFTKGKERVTFKDVAGLKEAKEDLEEVVDFLKNPKKFLDIGARIPRGVLLMGLPGTGKTLLARAIANEANVPFFHISGSEFVELFVGVGSARVRDLFQTAKKAAPAIVFIDEIDAIGRERGAGLGGGHDEREQTLNQILVEMDGFERDTNIIVMAATNRPDVLDPALLRPGRFDRRIVLDMPDLADREAILKIHSRGKPLNTDINLKQIAIRTPGFSGADLANLVNEAAILAARHNQTFVKQDDLYNSIERVILGPERKSRVISPKEKEITAYHEAGHALVAAGLKDADPVQKVSIISRGMAGGYTLKLPIEERRLKTKSQFLADLAVALGGYVSERVVFKEVSTGASNDLRQATEIGKKLITQYGMSDKLGPRTFGKTQELIFLGREISTEKDYSEEVAALIDKEMSAFIGGAEKTAKNVISANRRLLETIAKTLMEKESIEHEEFYKIINSHKLKLTAV